MNSKPRYVLSAHGNIIFPNTTTGNNAVLTVGTCLTYTEMSACTAYKSWGGRTYSSVKRVPVHHVHCNTLEDDLAVATSLHARRGRWVRGVTSDVRGPRSIKTSSTQTQISKFFQAAMYHIISSPSTSRLLSYSNAAVTLPATSFADPILLGVSLDTMPQSGPSSARTCTRYVPGLRFCRSMFLAHVQYGDLCVPIWWACRVPT